MLFTVDVAVYTGQHTTVYTVHNQHKWSSADLLEWVERNHKKPFGWCSCVCVPE